MEDACHGLDVLASLQQTSLQAGTTFTKYTDAEKKQSTLRDNISAYISSLEQILTLTVLSLPAASAQSNIVVQLVANEISLKKKIISEMV